MKHITTSLSILFFVTSICTITEAFHLSPSIIGTKKHTARHVSKEIDVDYYNPSRGIDMEHAHDCANHFGKCSIEELENLRSALHTERLQHQMTNFQSPNLDEEIDHRLLEEDLDFQLALLKDEMHTLPRWSSPHFITNGKPSFSPPPMMIDSSGNVAMDPNHQHQHDKRSNNPMNNMKSMIQRSEEMFLIPNGLGDFVAFAVAFFIISLTPFLFMK
jgi:hypothetical protein